MEKLLTLIIPTYNMERYLRTCLDSLITEGAQDTLEVLIINDGSKDTSSAIGHEYEVKHPDIFRVIDKENGNYGSCINRGLKEAKGRYVKILDADDHFDTAALAQFLQDIATIDTDLILTDNTIFGDNDISKKYYGFNLPSHKTLNFADHCDALKADIQMHNVTYKRSLFGTFDYHQTEGISYTDQEWIFAPMARVRTFIYLPLPLYRYLIGREGQTISPAQIVRSANHNVVLANSMLTEYAEADKTDERIKAYLEFRLARQVKYLYRIYLAEYPGLDTDTLMAFDQRLKTGHPALYDETGRRTMGPFIRIRYVDYWRRHHYAPQPRWFYTVFNAYNKTLNLAKRIFGLQHV